MSADATEELPEAQLTPMMKQYLEVKAQHADALLFFRLGDFYELFFDDAVEAAELLKITLTSRAKGADKVPMAGVPYHAARRYIARLIEAGRKVAICEQLEPPGKGIVRREVVRVVTPGMVLDDDVLEATQSTWLLAVAPPADDGPWGAALLEATTGELLLLEPGPAEGVAVEASRFAPRECLAPKGAPVEGFLAGLSVRPALSHLEADAFVPARSAAYLQAHLQVASLDGFGVAGLEASVGAAGAALRYLKETQRAQASHVDRLAVARRGERLLLDGATLDNLEILRSARDGGRKGSLLWAVDRTVTTLGARKLARWLAQPSVDAALISSRLDAVEQLFARRELREGLAASLGRVADLERLAARLALASGTPRDVAALGASLLALEGVGRQLAAGPSALLASLRGPLESQALAALGTTLARAIVDEPPAVAADGGFIRAGFDEELDRVVSLSSGGKDALAQLEQRERTRTGIQSLKVRYNRVFGYYLEVTRANLHLVPKAWTRKQTTAGGERYVTEELKTWEEQVLTADDRRVARELQLFEALRAEVLQRARELKAAAEAVATLDVLVGFARVAVEQGYTRPTIDDSTALDLEACRHPVVERVLPRGTFVPNDVHLDREKAQLLIITGPNMAGKSTVMRQTALAVILAQAGCFVPAARARVGLVDRVFTRVGASDNLARGQSTFMVEMTETAAILHQATRRSLVVLDEIGRGTATYDGLSIAWAVAEHLHDRVGARTLFATHYHELTDLVRERPRAQNASIAVSEHQGRVVFLHRLVPGAASRSYGIEVARLAGLPPEVLGRARELLHNLEQGELDEEGRPRLARPVAPRGAPPPAADGQLGLFTPPAPVAPPAALPPEVQEVLSLVRGLDVNALTPLQALNLLAEWRDKLRER